MFNAIFRKAQVTVDHAIGQAVNRVVVAIPFLVAAGFATAALTLRLVREFGAELGLVCVALLFALLGLICAAFMSSATRMMEDGSAQTNVEAADGGGVKSDDVLETGGTSVDKELVTAALTTVAPMALPAIFRALGRNLPLVAALAALLFIFTRSEPLEEPVVAS